MLSMKTLITYINQKQQAKWSEICDLKSLTLESGGHSPIRGLGKTNKTACATELKPAGYCRYYSFNELTTFYANQSGQVWHGSESRIAKYGIDPRVVWYWSQNWMTKYGMGPRDRWPRMARAQEMNGHVWHRSQRWMAKYGMGPRDEWPRIAWAQEMGGHVWHGPNRWMATYGTGPRDGWPRMAWAQEMDGHIWHKSQSWMANYSMEPRAAWSNPFLDESGYQEFNLVLCIKIRH